MVRDPSIVSDRSPVCFAAHEDEPAPLACARTLGYTHDNDEDDTLTSAKTTPRGPHGRLGRRDPHALGLAKPRLMLALPDLAKPHLKAVAATARRTL